jgi:predicted metal-binding protein
MEHYKVTLSEQERAQLQAIAGKGTHAASKVVNSNLQICRCECLGLCQRRLRTACQQTQAERQAGSGQQ